MEATCEKAKQTRKQPLKPSPPSFPVAALRTTEGRRNPPPVKRNEGLVDRLRWVPSSHCLPCEMCTHLLCSGSSTFNAALKTENRIEPSLSPPHAFGLILGAFLPNADGPISSSFSLLREGGVHRLFRWGWGIPRSTRHYSHSRHRQGVRRRLFLNAKRGVTGERNGGVYPDRHQHLIPLTELRRSRHDLRLT